MPKVDVVDATHVFPPVRSWGRAAAPRPRCKFGGMTEPATGVNGHVYIVSAARTPIGKFGGALSGATLLHELRRREGRYGLATLCLGGGGSVAAAFERV